MKRPPLKLTTRDSELLVDLYKHRFLSISQVQRMHFPSQQTAYRRMRVLREGCLVASFPVANIPESIFTLTAAGLQTVAGSLGVERDDLKWQDTTAKPRDYYFMRHFLAINDFRITLREACKEADVRLLGFIPDYYGERNEKGVVTKYLRDVIFDVAVPKRSVSHTPDGAFALERRGKTALFFLEVDRGTEVLTDSDKGVLKALSFYSSYLYDGKYQRYAKDFGVESFNGFRVLFVTTTEARVKKIRAACDALRVPAKARQFLWLTHLELLTPESLLRDIWLSADSTDQVRYQIIRAGVETNITRG